MKIIVTITLCLLATVDSLIATAQIPDVIIYDGKGYNLHNNPMELYFKEFPGKRPKCDVVSTALWRGYVATFEFEQDCLFLKDIKVEVILNEEGKEDHFYEFKSVIDQIIPNGEKLKIKWFSGILVLPHGELVNYVHMGYESSYSNYTLLEVSSGKLTGKREYKIQEYEAFKERQFEAYQRTEEYKLQLEEFKGEGRTKEFIDSLIKDHVVGYTSKFLDNEELSNQLE